MLVLGFAGCAASPSPAPKTHPLDEAIQRATEKIEERLDNGTHVALINVQSPTAQFSEYVLTFMESVMVNNGKLIVLDRSNLDKIRQEQGFQLSGEVSDESAKAIGKMLGAGAIVTGSLLTFGNSYRLTLKAINVETSTVVASYPADIANNERMKALLGTEKPPAATANSRTSTVTPKVTTQPAPAYKIGDTGPAGGIVFYDKGNSMGGWRYLEAAPAETERIAVAFSANGHNELVGSRKVGDGKDNTKKYIEVFQKVGGGINTAPWYCSELTINGFNDWYLPTLDELLYMYNNLFLKGIGEFKNASYWSSYVNGWWYVFCVDFSDATEKHPFSPEEKRYQVRAIRRF
jgi:hypothetical protein